MSTKVKSQKAIQAIKLAQNESRPLGREYVDTEKILLGLTGENTSNPPARTNTKLRILNPGLVVVVTKAE